MIDIRKADAERREIVLNSLRVWADDIGTDRIEEYGRSVNSALSIMMPFADLYGAESYRQRDLRREVARILGVKIDRRNKANHDNAARIDDVVDSFWYFTMAIRTILKADSKYIWGFEWHSRCNERRNGEYACQSLNGQKWALGDNSLPIPARDTEIGCNCLIFEVFKDLDSGQSSDSGDQAPRKSWLSRLLNI